MKSCKESMWALLVFAAVFAMTTVFAACSDGGVTTAEPEPEVREVANPDYAVGKIITFENEECVVVSNTVYADANRSARAEDTAIDVTAASIKRANKFVAQYVSAHILPLRIAAKVMIPYGKTKDDYPSAYNAAYTAAKKEVYPDTTEALTQEQESDQKFQNTIKKYFVNDADATKVEDAARVSLTDTYYILDKDENKLGSCLIKWELGTGQTFEGGKSLHELIQDYNPAVIRKSIPGEYKYRKNISSGDKYDYEVSGFKYYEDGRTSQLEAAKGSFYKYEEAGKQFSILKSASLDNDWDANGNWTKAYIDLCTTLGQASTNKGIQLLVRKTGNGYRYEITGSNASARKQTESSYQYKYSKNFTFSGNTYTEDNFVVPADTEDIYATTANLTFDEQTLSVPISFILNGDGSVSFGESVYAWVKHWRDYIVAHWKESDKIANKGDITVTAFAD